MGNFKDIRECFNLTVLVAALGYFVDLFDITLFGVVRAQSLQGIGITDPAQILSEGLHIYNMGMAGMMVGGLLWGILADKRGRLSVLFASILLYSLANIANAFVWNVEGYALCRFLGGVGLAGELGAAISLVAESLPKEKRGIGTTIVASLGMLGIVAAAMVGKFVPWKAAYIMGGMMGLCLLLVRFQLRESGMFTSASHNTNVSRGNFFMLFSCKRLFKYLACIAVGIPVYFTTGVLFIFAPELTKGLEIQGIVTAPDAVLYGSIGLTLGDLLSGLLSQKLRSRRWAILASLAVGLALMCIYTLGRGLTSSTIYTLCFLIGIAVGYWAVLVTMSAEQFGTNLRATVATTVPNFVRGSAIFAALGFRSLTEHMPVSQAALYVGLVCFGVAMLAVFFLKETFGKDLDYYET